MSSNILYHLESPPQPIFGLPYEVETGVPISLEDQIFSDELDLGGPAIGHAANPNCGFRLGVLDDCAKARFYARALEFYLMPNQHQNAVSFRCPMAHCPERFPDPKEMLKHLKHCKLFAKGEFFCPACRRQESFRVRSGRRCSWDKEHHLGQKFLQKSKDFFQGITGNRAANQQIQSHSYCANCWGFLVSGGSAQGGGHLGPFSQVHPKQATRLALSSNELHSVSLACPFPELDSVARSELCSNPSSTNSPTETYAQPAYTDSNPISNISDVSSVTMSPDGIPNSSSNSPTSPPDYEERHSVSRRPNSPSILSRASHRSAGFWGDSNINDPIADQHSASLYSSVPASQGLEFLTFSTAPLAHESFIGSLSPPLMPANHRNGLKLRIETPGNDINIVGPILDFQAPPHRSHLMNYAAGIPNQRVVSLPTEMIYQPPNDFLIATPDVESSRSEPSSSIDPSSSVSAVPTSTPQTSPSSFASDQSLQCPMCFKSFSKLSYLKKHLLTHDPKMVRCHFCDEEFTRKDNLAPHIRRIHDPNYKTPKRRRSSPDSFLSTPRRKKKTLRIQKEL
ncbi:hypothetical protein F5Y10DRAFT_48571 [Nemania abortiva]|nr:hypothetical protein F5Y10DRAFT_48571 [Nemania abortiva]